MSDKNDFGYYQVSLLILTQSAYIPVAATLLTSYLKPTELTCSNGWNETLPSDEFHSVLVEWFNSGACSSKSARVQTTISTVIMIGALIGSFVSGYLADRFGRKPVVIGSLSLLSTANALLLLASLIPWFFFFPVFLLAGIASGAYLTTNLVLVVESLSRSTSRLLVVALNGWSLSLAVTAFLAWLTPHWFGFHLGVCLLSMLCAVLLLIFAEESLPWLATQSEPHKFEQVATVITRFNGAVHPNDVPLVRTCKELLNSREEQRCSSKTSSYILLFRTPDLRVRVLSLALCFFVNSIVSYGMYQSVDIVTGSRYAAAAIMGVGKFLLGLLPFLLSGFVSGRIVGMAFVTCSLLASWTYFACILSGVHSTNVVYTVLCIVVTVALDPTWKVCHLYSTELFPVRVRNSARGFCNSAARVGSIFAPLAVHMRQSSQREERAIPYFIFGVLLLLQFFVSCLWLPELSQGSPDERISIDSENQPMNRVQEVEEFRLTVQR